MRSSAKPAVPSPWLHVSHETWLKAELHRLLTHSCSGPAVWLDECRIFYDLLCNRGYPVKAIDSSFRKVNWNQRRSLLEPRTKTEQDDSFFHEYGGCVFSNRNAPGTSLARGTAGARARRRAGHLPTKGLLCSAERAAAGTYFTTVIFASSMWPLQGVPKIVGIPVTCCDPSAVSCSTDARWAPFKLSYEGLNSYYGGQGSQ